MILRTLTLVILSAAALSALLMSAGCKTKSQRAEPVRLKVMSYNIRIGAGGGDWPSDPQKLDLEPVIRVMAEHGPDIVGVQEVDQFRKRSALMDQPAILRDRLGMNVAYAEAYSVTTGTAHDEKYGVALLAKYPIQPHTRYPLFKPDYSRSHPNYPDYYSEQRVLLHAPVMIGKRQVHLFVTHLGLTKDQRQEQIRQIAEITSRFSGPKILIGDFNASPDEAAMKLLEADFQDSLTVVGTPHEERKSYPGGLKPTEAIDYIFVSPEFRVLSARVVRDASLASDHNPVIAELELP
jgi:endonuclease/exonuclease/phosphatase family metal-dependent hydrolase